MNLTQNAFFFKGNAYKRFNTAPLISWYEGKSLFSPYDYGTAHAAAISYPVVHIMHLAYDVFNLARGIALFAIAALNLNGYAIGAIAEGLAVQFIAVKMDIINCALSALSLVTRNVCTAILGYALNESDRYNNYRYQEPEPQTLVYDTDLFGNPVTINLSQRKKSSDDDTIFNHTYTQW